MPRTEKAQAALHCVRNKQAWKAPMSYDVITAERVRDVLSGRSDVVEKRLMGGLCFMVSGNMCCSVSARGGLLIRVIEETRAELLSKPHVSPMQMGGRPVRSFIRVAAEGYRTDAALRKWIARALEAIAKLPAKKPPNKPTRRKAGAKPPRVHARRAKRA
jgi:TfoX/Sxy family transcriptional regulator of competence genes